MSWGGDLSTYGLQSLAVGEPVSKHLFFLEGVFPLAKSHELLPSMQIPQGLTMDVHLLLSSDINPAIAEGELSAQASSERAVQAEPAADPSCGWILLLDATAETQRQQQLQQKGNDLSLLRSKYAKLLRRSDRSSLTTPSNFLSEPEASIPFQSSQQGEIGVTDAELETDLSLRSQQDVSVLVIDLYDLVQSPSAQSSPEHSSAAQPSAAPPSVSEASFLERRVQKPGTAFDRATAAFSLITQSVIEEGGMVNHVLGTTMVVLFGVMPSLQSSAQQALSAANKLLRHYAQPLDQAKAPGQLRSHRIGMAISTGTAETGPVYIHGSQMVNAVGAHIQKAFLLSERSRPDTLIVDKTTLQSWKDNWEECWPDAQTPDAQTPDAQTPDARTKDWKNNWAEVENPLKSAFYSQILTTHHDYPDSRPQSLELYELTLTTSLDTLDRRDKGVGPFFSQPPP